MLWFKSKYKPGWDNLSINKSLLDIETIIADNDPWEELGSNPNIQWTLLSSGCTFYAPIDFEYNYLKCVTNEGTVFYFYKTGMNNITAIDKDGETLTAWTFVVDEWYTLYKPQFDVLRAHNPNVFIERALKDRYVTDQGTGTKYIDSVQQWWLFNNPATSFNNLSQIDNYVLTNEDLYSSNSEDLTANKTYFHIGTQSSKISGPFITRAVAHVQEIGGPNKDFDCFEEIDNIPLFGGQPTWTPNWHGSFKPGFWVTNAWIKGIDVYYDSSKITGMQSSWTCTLDFWNSEQHETDTGVTCHYVEPGHYHIDADRALVTAIGHRCYVKISNSESVNIEFSGNAPTTIDLPESSFDWSAPNGKYFYLILNSNCVSPNVYDSSYAQDMMNSIVVPVDMNNSQLVRALFTPFVDNSDSSASTNPELLVTTNSITGFIETSLPPLVVKNNNDLLYAQNHLDNSTVVTIPMWRNSNSNYNTRLLYLTESKTTFDSPNWTADTDPYFYVNPAVNQYLLDYSTENSPMPLNAMTLDFTQPEIEWSFIENWQDKLLLELSDANLSESFERRSIPNYYQFVYSDFIPYQTSAYINWIQNNPTTEATARQNYRDQTNQMNKDISLMKRQNAWGIASGSVDQLLNVASTAASVAGSGLGENPAETGTNMAKAVWGVGKFIGNSVLQTAAMNNKISAMRTQNDIQMRSLNSQFTNIKSSPNQVGGNITASYGYPSLGVIFAHRQLKPEQKNLIMNEFAQYGYILNYETNFNSIFNRIYFNPATINTSYNFQVLNQILRDHWDNEVLNTIDCRTQFLSFLSIPHVFYEDTNFDRPWTQDIESNLITYSITPSSYIGEEVPWIATMDMEPWSSYQVSGTYVLTEGEHVSSFPVNFSNYPYGKEVTLPVDWTYQDIPTVSYEITPSSYSDRNNTVDWTANMLLDGIVAHQSSGTVPLTQTISSWTVDFSEFQYGENHTFDVDWEFLHHTPGDYPLYEVYRGDIITKIVFSNDYFSRETDEDVLFTDGNSRLVLSATGYTSYNDADGDHWYIMTHEAGPVWSDNWTATDGSASWDKDQLTLFFEEDKIVSSNSTTSESYAGTATATVPNPN